MDYLLPREERDEDDRDDDERDEDERREPLLERARPELLLRDGRPAPEDERRGDDDARDERLLGRLELLDDRDGRAEGRLDERLGATDRPLLLPDGLLGLAERLLDERELRPDRVS